MYTDRNHTKETYNSSGQLISIEQRNGQAETLEYNVTVAQGGDDDAATLDRVTGPFGHTLTFAYDTNGRLSSVSTPDGLFQYSYDSNGNLEYVTHPDATTRQYHYEDANYSSHLTGITDENLDRYATWAYDVEGRAVSSEHAGGKELVQLAYNIDGTTTLTMANNATRIYNYSTEQGKRKLAMLTGDVCGGCPGGNIAERTYDANGFLNSVIDWNGHESQTIRNSRGLTESLIEGKGTALERTTTITWHATLPLPLTVAAPKNTTTYTYDVDGNLLTATKTSGSLSRASILTYDADGRVLTIDGPRTDVTDVTTLAYYHCTTGNECGQVHTVTNALGHVATYNAYDASGRVTLMTDPNGLQTAFSYDSRGNVLSLTRTPTTGSPEVTTMTYDGVGQLLTMTSPAGVTLTYTYDAAHYLTSVTDNFGNKIEYTYDIMGNVTDEKTYDPSQVLARQMQYTYDINNRFDTVTNGGVISDLMFDLVGNLTSEVDGNGNTTTNSYDVLDRLDTITDALSGVVDLDYDDHDNLTQAVAANGATTNYVYDDLDNLVSETSPDRGLITYTYDDAGNRLSAIDARGVTATYTYDALNRLLSVSYPTASQNVTYTYDAAGELGYLSATTDESGTTTYTYDGFGRIASDTRQISGVSYATSYTYDSDGNIASVTYPSGRVVTYGRNVIGEITQVTSNFGGVSKPVVSTAAYAPFGPLENISYGNGVVFDYLRQSDYKAADIISAGIASKEYSYDSGGNVLVVGDNVDASLNRAFTYDPLNRLETESAGSGASYSEIVLADNPLGYWRLGEQAGTTVVDETGNGYDSTYSGTLSLGEEGLVKGADTAIGIDAIGGGYAHGPTLTGTTLTAVELWEQTASLHSTYGMTFFSLYKYPSSYTRIGISHYPDGTIGVWQGKTRVMSSDTTVSLGEPHHIAVWYESAVNTTYLMIDGIVQQDTYTGNLLATPDPEVLMAAFRYYNTLYTRFVGLIDEVAIYTTPMDASTFAAHAANGPPDKTYTYSANGNRSSLDDGSANFTYAYDAFSNRLNAISGSTVQLDAAGNQTSDQGGARTFAYNDVGRLVEVRNNGNLTATYQHNALGQRVRKTTGSTDVVYVYDIMGNLLSEFTASGTHIRDYVWMDGMPVAQVDAGETFTYLHFDHLGTPRWGTDDAQTVVWRWDSDAFGATAANNDPDGDSSATTVNLRFPGQYYDSETGFHYNYFRTYDPSTGRYLESDPIGLQGGSNTYAYVGGNPLVRFDSFGLACNSKGCYPTEGERQAANAGDWAQYYNLACAGGDPYACNAGEVAANAADYGWRNTMMNATNEKLRKSLLRDLDDACMTEEEKWDDVMDRMERIRQDLAKAHLDTLDNLGASPTNPANMSRQAVSDFHRDVFSRHGASSGEFGGDFVDRLGGQWFRNYVYDWCPSPSCSR